MCCHQVGELVIYNIYVSFTRLLLSCKLHSVVSSLHKLHYVFKRGGNLVRLGNIAETVRKSCKLDTPSPLYLLFYDDKAKKVITTSQVNMQLQRILDKHDIIDDKIFTKVLLLSLRHTYLMRCIEAGMTAEVLRELLGHIDIRITINTYTDVFDKFHSEN